MTYITTGIHQPGIVELLFYKGPTGKALSRLAHTLLHGPSPLTPGERELIASYVSSLNDCEFCTESHSASAAVHLNDGGETARLLRSNISKTALSDKMKALLRIAGQISKSGRDVKQEHIDAARNAGANDEEIHDTVLVAAAFCMYNRYVDGLATSLPGSREEYGEMGHRMARSGYKYPPLFLRKLVIRSMNRKNGKPRT